jgi:putative transposase
MDPRQNVLHFSEILQSVTEPSRPTPDCFTPPNGATGALADAGIRISMDGRGRWMDNVFIERLWRSLKYECVFLNAFETGGEARTGIGRWIDFYNQRRPHSALGDRNARRGLCYRNLADEFGGMNQQDPP